MRLVSIASGSSGNCIYVGSDQSHILVDAGISNKRIEQGLNDIGLKGAELDGVVITHEHSDHIKGLGVLARKHHVPIYGTEETLKEIAANTRLGKYPKELLHPILPDVDFQIGDLTLEPFSIHHDAANPVAYRVSHERKSVAVATDMGHYDQYVIDHLKDLDALLLEANHDVNMLETGPYPYYLKTRIASQRGHLCNEENAATLVRLLENGCERFALCHISQENNTPELALESVRAALLGAGVVPGRDCVVNAARRHEVSPIIEF